MSDNTQFDLRCTPLEPSLVIAFDSSPSKKASHWKIVPEEKKLLLAWSENAGPDFKSFFSPIDAKEAMEIVKAFIRDQDFGPEPDHDGDNGKSWRIYNESWNYVGNNRYVFVAIEPMWSIYGK